MTVGDHEMANVAQARQEEGQKRKPKKEERKGSPSRRSEEVSEGPSSSKIEAVETLTRTQRIQASYRRISEQQRRSFAAEFGA